MCLVQSVFLRALGVVYLCAFLSLAVQLLGLIGDNGIAPASQLMKSAHEQLHGFRRYLQLPTLCWINSSDGFLQFQCGAGSMLSLALILGFAPAPILFCLWLLYLSLTTVSDIFLAYQWESLLLESGFLAIFFAPLQWKLRRGSRPSLLILWMFRWLLFRLLFESGCVKLLSGDQTWSHLTALNYHYETQPLPTWIGWYAHQLPEGIHQASVALMLALELAVPIFFFLPRTFRLVACGLEVGLQVAVALTGNYCYFNLLTLALGVLLLDDQALMALFPRRLGAYLGTPVKSSAGEVPDVQPNLEPTHSSTATEPPPDRARSLIPSHWPIGVALPISVFLFLITSMRLIGLLRMSVPWPAWFRNVYLWQQPFRSANHYGLFAIMTTNRFEIVIEGSNDGRTWSAYEFKCKPGDPARRPAFVAPHQPRLDWQMWFAALGTYRDNPWFLNFCTRLLQGSPQVLGLIGRNPFPERPPRYIQATLYQYHFTNYATRRKIGQWWEREFKGLYCPTLSLKEK